MPEVPPPSSPARRRPSRRTLSQHIGGARVPASGGTTFEDADPWDGRVLFDVAAGGAPDALAAADAAAAAQPAWGSAPPAARQEVFLAAAAVVERRRPELVGLLAHETGCTLGYGGTQVDLAAALLRQLANEGYAPTGELLPSDSAGTAALAARAPAGVVAAIVPWNAALVLGARAVAGPLAVGNAVVLKPSEEAPCAGGTVWAEVFAEAGLPGGVLDVVTHAPGRAGEVAEALLSHRAVRRVNFTGSTATGRRLAEAAGRQLTPVLLQLGGRNPMIVLDDVDLAAAAHAASVGAFTNQGQLCMNVRRVLVTGGRAAELATRMAAEADRLVVGDPSDPATDVGPLITRWALSTVARRVDEAVAAGATLHAGGTTDGPCYRPTVLTGVPEWSELGVEETFGPVVVVEDVADAEEAVAAANASPYALAASVVSGDLGRGLDVARRLDAGIVHVNDHPVHDEPHAPFGGTRDSGWGRFGARQAAQEFTELRWMTYRPAPPG